MEERLTRAHFLLQDTGRKRLADAEAQRKKREAEAATKLEQQKREREQAEAEAAAAAEAERERKQEEERAKAEREQRERERTQAAAAAAERERQERTAAAAEAERERKQEEERAKAEREQREREQAEAEAKAQRKRQVDAEAERNRQEAEAATKQEFYSTAIRGHQATLLQLLESAEAGTLATGGGALNATLVQRLNSHSVEVQQLLQGQQVDNAARQEIDAILQSRAHRRYYLSFLTHFRSALTACEAIHSGMVDGSEWSASSEAQDFVKNAMRPGGSFREAAKGINWKQSLAAGIASAKENLSGIPFVSTIGGILEYLLTAKDEAEEKEHMLRAAIFQALVAVEEAKDARPGVLERAARGLTRRRWRKLADDQAATAPI